MTTDTDDLSMEELSAMLSELPPRFRLGCVGDGRSPTLGDITASPESAEAWVDEARALFGAPGTSAAASMAVQHVARVLGASTLMCAIRLGALPMASAAEVQVGPGIDSEFSYARTQYSFAILGGPMRHGGPDELFDVWAEHWLDGVLEDLSAAVAGAVRVGARMLRDNIVTAAASNLVIFDWWQGDAGFDRFCHRLVELGSPSFGESVAFTPSEFRGRTGWRPDRTSCCLEFKCDPPRYCPSCPKIDVAERDEILAGHLTNLAQSTTDAG